MKEMKEKAKLEALMKLKRSMKEDDHAAIGKKMGDKFAMKKVVIASPTEDGLEEGLSLAEKIMQKRKGMKDMELEEESDEEMGSEDEECPVHGEECEGNKYSCGGMGKHK